MPNSKELRTKSQQELQQQLEQLQHQLLRLRNEKQLSKRLEKPHQLRATRKEIARIHTLLTERAQGVAEV
jgi:large subunit ribosomal protein L29